MKKIVLVAATIAATGIGAWFGLSAFNPKTENLSDLMLKNIEALAREESDDNNPGKGTRYKCYSSIHYDEKSTVVLCSTCKEVANSTDDMFCFHDWCYRN